MNIYTRVVMDMARDDLPVIESESCEYDGPLALCWGIGGPGDNDDGRDGYGGANSAGNRGGGDNSGSNGDGRGGLGGNHGGGGYGDMDAPGAMSPNDPTSLGGFGGWGDGKRAGADHSNVNDPAPREFTGPEMNVMENVHRALGPTRQTRLGQAMYDLGLAFETAWHGNAIGAVTSTLSGNPLGMVYNTAQAINHSQAISDMMGQYGLGPVSGPGSGLGEQGENDGAVVADAREGYGLDRNMPEQRGDVASLFLRELLGKYNQGGPESIIDDLPGISRNVAQEAGRKAVEMGIPEMLRRQRGGMA